MATFYKQRSTFESVEVRNPGVELRRRLEKDDDGDPVLCENLIKTLCDLIVDGNTLDNASRVCGLRPRLLAGWVRKGQGDLEEKKATVEAELVRELDAALADQEYQLSKVIFKKASNDPKLALETLARRNPVAWSPALPEPINYEKVYGKMGLQDAKAEVKRLLNEKEEEKDGND